MAALRAPLCCLQIVNLVSNDVRRFDDAMPFWAFLWVGPLELTCVLVLLSIQLGAPAAFAGVATMLLVIPLQVSARLAPSLHTQSAGLSTSPPLLQAGAAVLELSLMTCELFITWRSVRLACPQAKGSVGIR